MQAFIVKVGKGINQFTAAAFMIEVTSDIHWFTDATIMVEMESGVGRFTSRGPMGTLKKLWGRGGSVPVVVQKT